MPFLDEYWKHKLDQLWKEVEDLKKRVAELESKTSNRPPVEKESVGLIPVKVQSDSRILPPAPIIKKTEFEDPVVATLKEKGALNIIDLNEALKEKGISEGVRETLFNRVKPLLKKGDVKYDETTQLFSVP